MEHRLSARSIPPRAIRASPTAGKEARRAMQAATGSPFIDARLPWVDPRRLATSVRLFLSDRPTGVGGKKFVCGCLTSAAVMLLCYKETVSGVLAARREAMASVFLSENACN